MRGKTWLGALALALAPAAWADEPADWLVKMSEAARAATYQGVVIYRGNDALETFRVTHRRQDGVELERVQSLNGEPRDILKQNDKVICLLPNDRRMSSNRPTPKGLFPGVTPERVRQIAQIYALDDLGVARVAGRSCRGIAITPRDEFRYGYEVWADAQTAVPLKVNLIGRDGSTLEQMMFTEVDFPASIPDTAFDMPREGDKAALAAREAPPAPAATAGPGDVQWVLDQLPPGFQVTMRDWRVLPNNRGTVEHLLVSDGLTAISIFSAQRPAPARPLRGISQIGAIHAYGRMIGQFHITVVGEAPEETVKRIGDGLKPADARMIEPAKP